jgi:hypothetical protein
MSTAVKFTRLPEAMELADIGPYLASIRAHYRLSVQDVSSHLHMRVRYIDAIESSQFDLLPGKVYARGYVQQYAEFLGIDPDQVVEKCFGPQPEKKDDFFVPEPARTSNGPIKSWVLLLAVGFCAYAIYDYTSITASSESGSQSVAPVPETMMQQFRSLPFPTGSQLRCMGGQSVLACAQWPAKPRTASLMERG